MGMRVIGVDHPSKKELVLNSGAEHFIDHTTSKDVGADVKALTGGLGAEAVLVLTAANPAYARYVILRLWQDLYMLTPSFQCHECSQIRRYLCMCWSA